MLDFDFYSHAFDAFRLRKNALKLLSKAYDFAFHLKYQNKSEPFSNTLSSIVMVVVVVGGCI